MKSLSIVLIAALASVPTPAFAQRDPVRTVAPAVPAAPPAPSSAVSAHIAVPAAPVRSINEPAVHTPATVNAITAPIKITGIATQYHPDVIPQSNPVYGTPAWGWNHGAFWGASLPGEAMTAKIMGSIIHGNQIYQSYGVSPGSPGAKLLANYGLRQVSCGTPGLVVIYGPSFGVVCAYPTYRVGAGNYNVNIYTQTITGR